MRRAFVPGLARCAIAAIRLAPSRTVSEQLSASGAECFVSGQVRSGRLQVRQSVGRRSAMTDGDSPAHVLVVAHKTAASPALLEAVRDRAARVPCWFHLLDPLPAPKGWHHENDVAVGRRVLDDAL